MREILAIGALCVVVLTIAGIAMSSNDAAFKQRCLASGISAAKCDVMAQAHERDQGAQFAAGFAVGAVGVAVGTSAVKQ